LLHQRSCSTPCRSHPPPRDTESTEKFRDSWSVLRSNRPRAWPLYFGSLPRSTEWEPIALRGVAATTVGRIEAPLPSHRVHRSSTEPSVDRRSLLGSKPRLLSPSTRGRQNRSCGSLIAGWPINSGGMRVGAKVAHPLARLIYNVSRTSHNGGRVKSTSTKQRP
jgi:hypothetical protein